MKYTVELFLNYNGLMTVEADSPEEAIQKANDTLCGKTLEPFPDRVEIPDGHFDFGEATADYAYPYED